MTVRKFRPPNRLASMIKERGGVLAKDAIIAAEAGVESLREASLAALDETIAEIDQRFGKGAANRADESFEDLYLLSSKIIDVGQFVADVGIDKAAMSLCALADSLAEARTWRWDAVDVHLNALRLLRTVGQALPAAQRESMLEGLYQVSHHRPDGA
jgi:hypothetical protein